SCSTPYQESHLERIFLMTERRAGPRAGCPVGPVCAPGRLPRSPTTVVIVSPPVDTRVCLAAPSACDLAGLGVVRPLQPRTYMRITTSPVSLASLASLVSSGSL